MQEMSNDRLNVYVFKGNAFIGNAFWSARSSIYTNNLYPKLVNKTFMVYMAIRQMNKTPFFWMMLNLPVILLAKVIAKLHEK